MKHIQDMVDQTRLLWSQVSFFGKLGNRIIFSKATMFDTKFMVSNDVVLANIFGYNYTRV